MLNGHCKRGKRQGPSAENIESLLQPTEEVELTCLSTSVTASGSNAYAMRPNRAAAVHQLALMLTLELASRGSLNGAHPFGLLTPRLTIW